MRGRITLRTPQGLLVSQFMADLMPGTHFSLRFNVAPTQSVPVVRVTDGKRQLTAMHWADPVLGQTEVSATARLTLVPTPWPQSLHFVQR